MMHKCPHCPAEYSTEQELRVHRDNRSDHMFERRTEALERALAFLETLETKLTASEENQRQGVIRQGLAALEMTGATKRSK